MKNSEYRWIDTAIGNVNSRNKIVDVTKLKVKPGTSECYRTIFRFQDDLKNYVASTGSVKGYRGSAYTDYFPIDIDDPDLIKSLDKARALLNRLETVYDVNLNELWCFFSGSKGFHILIPEPMIGFYASSKLPAAFKEMAKEILHGTSYDASIYEHLKLFRIANTINAKSGLHKVPITPAEMLHKNIAEIIDMSAKPRKVEFCPADEISENEALRELFSQSMKQVNREEGAIVAPTTIQPPKESKLCYYGMLNGVSEGERDNAAVRLATFFRKQGLPSDITLGVLMAWNKRNNPPLKQSDMEKFVYQAYDNLHYDYGCKDHLLQQFCDSKCYLKKRKEERVSDSKVYNIQEARKKYEEYVAELEKRKILLGIDMIDKRLRGIAPGEVMQIIARSAVGKTAILLNIIKNVGQKGITTLFFSLEMPVAQIYERTVQIGGGYEGQEVERTFQTKNPNRETMSKITEETYGNMWVVDQDFLTLEELKEYVTIAEAKIGKSIGLLCVDYLGRMKGGYGGEYEVVSELAKQLKNLAKETDKAVICLHQTNRSGGTGAEPITMDMARGSGVLEEAADHIIGAWRPDIDKPEAQREATEKIVLAILKGRKGPRCVHEMILNKRKLTLYETDIMTGSVEVPIKGELPFD